MKPLISIIGAATFGAWVGLFLALAASWGLQYIFPEGDREEWGFMLWGEHWFTRLIVSLVTTFLGGLFAGLAASGDGRKIGMLSAIPTSLSWVAVGLLGIAYATEVRSPSIGSWATILVAGLFSPFLGGIAGSAAEHWRSKNTELFGKQGRPLGIHWANWLWIWIPYYFLVGQFAYCIFLLLYVDFQHPGGIIGGMGRGFIAASVFALGYGGYQAFKLLMSGHTQEFTNGQVAFRVFGYLAGLPALSVVLLAIGFIFLGIKEKLPWWVPFL